VSPTNLSFYIRKRTVLNQVLDLEEVQARGAVGTLASFSPFEGEKKTSLGVLSAMGVRS